jgi:hypothetical protein
LISSSLEKKEELVLVHFSLQESPEAVKRLVKTSTSTSSTMELCILTIIINVIKLTYLPNGGRDAGEWAGGEKGDLVRAVWGIGPRRGVHFHRDAHRRAENVYSDRAGGVGDDGGVSISYQNAINDTPITKTGRKAPGDSYNRANISRMRRNNVNKRCFVWDLEMHTLTNKQKTKKLWFEPELEKQNGSVVLTFICVGTEPCSSSYTRTGPQRDVTALATVTTMVEEFWNVIEAIPSLLLGLPSRDPNFTRLPLLMKHPRSVTRVPAVPVVGVTESIE